MSKSYKFINSEKDLISHLPQILTIQCSSIKPRMQWNKTWNPSVQLDLKNLKLSELRKIERKYAEISGIWTLHSECQTLDHHHHAYQERKSWRKQQKCDVFF